MLPQLQLGKCHVPLRVWAAFSRGVRPLVTLGAGLVVCTPHATHTQILARVHTHLLACYAPSISRMDFSNPSLRNLMRAMAPVKLRIGGTSSHGLVFTNAASPPGCGPAVCASSCCGNKTSRDEVFLSTTCIDSIGDFLLATGAELLFNLAPTRLDPPSISNNSAWNSTNSELLLAHVGKQPYAHLVTGLEVGNEQPTITSATQLGMDLLLAQSLAAKHGLNVQTVGPSLPKRCVQRLLNV